MPEDCRADCIGRAKLDEMNEGHTSTSGWMGRGRPSVFPLDPSKYNPKTKEVPDLVSSKLVLLTCVSDTGLLCPVPRLNTLP